MASGDMQNMGKPAPSDAKSTSVPKGYPELRDELQERKAHTLARLHIRVHTSAHSKRERSKKHIRAHRRWCMLDMTVHRCANCACSTCRTTPTPVGFSAASSPSACDGDLWSMMCESYMFKAGSLAPIVCQRTGASYQGAR